MNYFLKGSIRILMVAIASAAICIAGAGTLTVTSPNEGAFLGTSNTVRFIVRGASLEVRVKVVAQGPGGSTTIEQAFTPNAQGEINESIPLNFSAGSPEGPYTITVTATEPGNTYNTEVRNVTVDVTKPKFLEFSPNDNSFVKGVVPIRVKILEPNVKEYRVQINDQDIPNNTGGPGDIVNGVFTVNWDTSGILQDGSQTIKISVKDEANNEETRTITVTLDRVNPTITIQFPRSDTRIRPRSTINVVVDIQDGSENSVHVTGVDVIFTRMDGSFLLRVPRISFSANGATNSRWSGRVKWRNGQLPSQFKVRVTAIDRAGNVAVPQETTINIR